MGYRQIIGILLVILMTQQITAFKHENKTTTERVAPKYDSRYFVQNYTVNPHPFEYIYNPKFDVCKPTDEVYLMVYVHSTPRNFKRRIALRETWARRSMFRDLRVVFTMGQTDESKVNERLKLEYDTYHDLVQENFDDSYKNLTYKGIMAVKWLSTYCKQAKYILKTDDDIFTNVYILLRHLDSLEKHGMAMEKTFMCAHYYEFAMPVMREPSKWYVPPELFAADSYSQYCSGSAFLFTGDLPKEMYEVSKRIRFFWVDDFYISGLVASGCNVTYKTFESLYKIFDNVESIMHDKIESKVYAHLPGGRGQNSIYGLWKHAYSNQMSRYINLKKNEASILKERDYFDNKDLNWDMDIWQPYLNQPVDSDSNLFFQQDTF